MNADQVTLPELTDERIAELEDAVFSEIARGRGAELARAERERARAVRRGRWWMGGAVAAGVIAIAAVIAPQVLSSVQGTSGSLGSAAVAPASDMDSGFSSTTDSMENSASGGSAESTAADTAREIATSASATVEVDDASAAATAIGDAAVAAGGYVETMSIGSTAAIDPSVTSDVAAPDYAPLWMGSWITVRVPADDLAATLAHLSDLGKVTSSQIDRRDVTTEAVDLRARVSALEGSVTRLTALMAESESTADLIAAEAALAERQSELDSLRQQLTWLEGQVDLASATITLVTPAPAVQADPAGFGDGLAAGWNGMLASLNGIVIAIGFLLPWLAVAVVVTALVWAVRRIVRRRRSARAAGSAASAAED